MSDSNGAKCSHPDTYFLQLGCGATALGHFDGDDVKNAITKMINTVQIYGNESNIDGRYLTIFLSYVIILVFS